MFSGYFRRTGADAMFTGSLSLTSCTTPFITGTLPSSISADPLSPGLVVPTAHTAIYSSDLLPFSLPFLFFTS